MYYKVLAENGQPHHGGSGQWPLPHGKRPGAWLEVKGELVPCRNGLHLCRKGDLLGWLGPVIYEVEADEAEIVRVSDKVVVRRARLVRRLDTWNETTARLFAADCAKDAVRRCRKAGIEIDPRVDECIRVVYRFARGEANAEELAAARSEAWSARSEAWSARSEAWSACSAACSAAGSAAGSAAESAAWSAAESAAGSAVESAAGSAAGSAAWSAVESAAWSAAESAAWSWQTKRLFDYLEERRS